jgi:transaldolase
MNAPQRLHALGQSLWLDNITRDLLDGGTLARYIDELSVTGLTSNPTIFDQDPRASDILYIKALAAPSTVNTMPEATLKALADHGDLGAVLPTDGGDAERVLARFADAGIDADALAARLQDEGAKAFVTSWNDLMMVIAGKRASIARAS